MSDSVKWLSNPSLGPFLSKSYFMPVRHWTGKNWTRLDRMMEANAGVTDCFLGDNGYIVTVEILPDAPCDVPKHICCINLKAKDQLRLTCASDLNVRNWRIHIVPSAKSPHCIDQQLPNYNRKCGYTAWPIPWTIKIKSVTSSWLSSSDVMGTALLPVARIERR